MASEWDQFTAVAAGPADDWSQFTAVDSQAQPQSVRPPHTQDMLMNSPYPAMNQGITVPEIPYANTMPHGMVRAGNITDPALINGDTQSNEFVNHGVHLETLLPGSGPEAVNRYTQTGQHLGQFDTPENANAFAQQLSPQAQAPATQADAIKTSIAKKLAAGQITPEAARNVTRYMDNDQPGRVAATMQGMTLGLSDELGGGAAGLGAALKGQPYLPAYQGERDAARGAEQQFTDDHPYQSAALNALGSAPLALLPGGSATTLAGRMGQAAAVGGATGTAYGFNSGEGGIVPRLENAAKFGVPSALLGATTPPVQDAVQWAGGKALDAAKAAARATRSVNAPEIAGNILNRAAGTGGITVEDAPIPGMSLSTGQATNNPGLQFIERSMDRATPEGVTANMEARTQNNQAIRQAINTLGDATADSPAAMAKRLEAAQNAGKANYRAAWKAAGIDENTNVPKGLLQDRVDEFLGGLKEAERRSIPKDILDTLEAIPDQRTTLGEIQAWRADLGDAKRFAERNGQTANKARILRNLEGVVGDFIDELPENVAESLSPADIARYKAARDSTRLYKETYVQPREVRNVLGVDSYGADKVPVSATADQFIRSGKGAPEALQTYLKAVGDDKDALQAARDAFTRKFLNSASTTVPDMAGDRVVAASGITRFVDDHQHIIDSKLFEPSQRALITNIQKAADMAQRTARGTPPGGSDTFANLSGRRFVDVLIGPGASKIIPAASAIAGFTQGGFIGAGVGLMAGVTGENVLEKALFGATRDKVMDVLQQAMRDPKLAQALMMKASAANAKMIPRATATHLYGLLGLAPVGSVARTGFPPPANEAENNDANQIYARAK